MAVTRVTSRDLKDQSIGNDDISPDAGIEASKIAMPQGNFLVGDANGKGSPGSLPGLAQDQSGLAPGPDATAVSNGFVLRADGAWVPNGGSFAENETPQGTGQPHQFTLANAPGGNSLRLFKNGIRQMPGSGADYTLAGATISFEPDNVPQSGDVLLADYRF